MKLKLENNYEDGLKNAKPMFFPEQVKIVNSPSGVLSSIRTKNQLIIPPLNTIITFDKNTKQFNALKSGLQSISSEILPEEFNWRKINNNDTDDIKKKKTMISKPGNQALCGSCWAITAAGVVGDNFVISNLVDWEPNLSTTWCLACYPQMQCKGGNPGELFANIHTGGIVSNHCVDYSWCINNEFCNGSALKHFKESKEGPDPSKVDLSSLIPKCGCYFGDKEHYLYKIEQPYNIFIGASGVTEGNISTLIKKQIYTKGSVLAGFLVFKNFIKGDFSQVNGGVYLERGNYDTPGSVTFSDSEIDSNNYVGSHAVAIIGWGVEKNISIDNGRKADVPYWYCRNSWTTNWGDNGYFKMAMYPYNKFAQFEKQTIIESKGKNFRAGGIIFFDVIKKPELKTMAQLQEIYMKNKRIHDDNYYKTTAQNYNKSKKDNNKDKDKDKDKDNDNNNNDNNNNDNNNNDNNDDNNKDNKVDSGEISKFNNFFVSRDWKSYLLYVTTPIFGVLFIVWLLCKLKSKKK